MHLQALAGIGAAAGSLVIGKMFDGGRGHHSLTLAYGLSAATIAWWHSAGDTLATAAQDVFSLGASLRWLVTGGTLGAGLITRIVRGYTFISRNYRAGDRIYITGLSMGGYGTWDAIQRHPQRFAAAAPICAPMKRRS